MKKIKELFERLYKISNSNAAYSFIIFAIMFVSTKCALSAWHDDGIVNKLKEIEDIIK